MTGNYNWCHGPSCHTNHTQSRIRGSGDNKVLRTIKIRQGRYNYNGNTFITLTGYSGQNLNAYMDGSAVYSGTKFAVGAISESFSPSIIMSDL